MQKASECRCGEAHIFLATFKKGSRTTSVRKVCRDCHLYLLNQHSVGEVWGEEEDGESHPVVATSVSFLLL